MKKAAYITWLGIGVFILFELFIFAYLDENHPIQVGLTEFPSSLSFAGESIPLSDADVHERLDREMLINTFWHSQTFLFFKRANKWFPTIEPILKKNHIPDDFKYLALTESALINVVSPSGACGYWQFLEATGKKYGLRINEEVDERYHIEKSTEAFCKYMHEAHAEFGSWILASASYNMGIAGVKKQLERQKANNYFDLMLNEETSRYVFRMIAVKVIMASPQSYGYEIRKKDLYEPPTFDIITIDSSISDMASFAEKFHMNYKNLKVLNPWLRQNNLTNKEKRTYEIKITKN